jgi:hypothetical protein
MDCHLTLTDQDARRLIRNLLLLEAALVLLYVGERSIDGSFWFIRRLLDLDGERSVAMWFSSLQLFTVGAVLLLKARHPGALAPLGTRFLFLVGAAFVFLSADEALSFHESLTDGLARYGWLPQFDGGHGMWIPFYLAAVFTFLLWSLPRLKFLLRSFRGPTLLVLCGFAAFVTGAVGVEIIGYRIAPIATPAVQLVEVACEEWLEMAGITLVLAGTLGLVREQGAPARVPVVETRFPARTP